MIREWTRGDFTISTDPRRLDLDAIHRFLVRSYWAEGIPRDVMERSIANSLPFGLYERSEQVGFARVVSDLATYAYLTDVIVAETARRQGIGSWMVEAILSHPDLQGLRRVALYTRDAQALYERYGFSTDRPASVYMELRAR